MSCVTGENQTQVTEFLFLGLSYYSDHRLVFILIFLMLYLLTVVGNTFIITATNLDPQLHTPMYFFISNLSFVDLCLTSVTVPNYLGSLLSKNLSIPFQGCLPQMFFFLWLGNMETFLLDVMSYDRYVAICNPLFYMTVMTEEWCFLLVVASWVLTCLQALLHVSLTFHLCFCGPNIINSFFCDHPPVLALSCSDTSLNHLLLLSEGLFVAGLLFTFILCTYARIITSILRLRSAESCQKAFLTCSSHITFIALFFVTAGALYFLPSSPTQKQNNIFSSMMYALVAPMINPYIYCLWNKEIQVTLKKSLSRKKV